MIVRRLLPYHLSALLITTILWTSCNKMAENPSPIAVWEDKSADSVTFSVVVQTQVGIFMIGTYVNLALSLDSLNKGLLVRHSSTDGAGRARFNRLYPRQYYSNCFANYLGQSLYASFKIQLPPAANRDTTIIVH